MPVSRSLNQSANRSVKSVNHLGNQSACRSIGRSINQSIWGPISQLVNQLYVNTDLDGWLWTLLECRNRGARKSIRRFHRLTQLSPPEDREEEWHGHARHLHDLQAETSARTHMHTEHACMSDTRRTSPDRWRRPPGHARAQFWSNTSLVLL